MKTVFLKKLTMHSLVWLAVVLFRTLLIAPPFNFEIVLMRSFLLTMVYIIVFYAIAYIHKYLFEYKKYAYYSFALLIIFLLGVQFFQFVMQIIQSEQGVFFPIFSNNIGYVRVGFIMLVSVFYQVIRSRQRIVMQKKAIELEKSKVELQHLKQQMNPHFFFNTLNNIYGLTYNKDDRAPQIILMLSEAMRYIIYETNHSFVSLQKEVSFISSYIHLEKLRLPSALSLSFHYDLTDTNHVIAPLILLPLIENCFKHVDVSSNGEIEISLWMEQNKLFLSTRNTYNFQEETQSVKGIGTDNLKKRLEMIYSEKYQLEVHKDKNNYFVLLSINLSI